MTLRILGARVMGLVLATELSARGHAVELVDPAPTPGPHACSWWAGGMLAPYCEAESATPAVLQHGLGAAGWRDRHTGMVRRTRRPLAVMPLGDHCRIGASSNVDSALTRFGHAKAPLFGEAACVCYNCVIWLIGQDTRNTCLCIKRAVHETSALRADRVTGTTLCSIGSEASVEVLQNLLKRSRS